MLRENTVKESVLGKVRSDSIIIYYDLIILVVFVSEHATHLTQNCSVVFV